MKKLAAAVLAMVALLLGSSWAWSAEGVRGEIGVGWYKCASAVEEEEGKDNSVSKTTVSEKMEQTPVSTEVKSPLIDKVRDAYSIKRPEAKEITVVVGKIPASYHKFAKGLNIGTVAVGSKKTVRGNTIPAGQDNKMGQVSSLTIFEEKIDPDSEIFCSDRWYDNRLFGEKRGETVIFNLAGRHEKLNGGMFLRDDRNYIELIAKTYGTPAADLSTWEIKISELDHVIKVVLSKKCQTPDGIRYTSIELPIFKKLYAQPALTHVVERFLNNGGLAIGIPPELISSLANVIIAAVTAILDTRHNIPCLSSLSGGVERFECDQRFYEAGGALTSRDFERAKRGPALSLGQQYGQKNASGNPFGGSQNFQNGNAGVEDILAQIQPVSPTGYPQDYNSIGFWLEPKRVEWPSGGGMFTSPQLRTEYGFSNTHLHLFGGEIAPNATFHWGPHFKMDRWKYRTDMGYHGHGQFIGGGGSAELVMRHKWGGTDNRFSFAYGHQWDKGLFHHDRRAPWMLEWQMEAWRDGIKLGEDGEYGQLLSGAKMGVLAKTNDSLLVWFFPVLYRGPYDLGKISIGGQFLQFFSRFGDEPKGGGLGVLIEPIDGLGYRFSYFPFKRGMYHTGWVDPYRIYAKLKELEAEFGIYEIPWDSYSPKVIPAAISAVQPPVATPKWKPSPPAPGPECVEKKVKKYKKRPKKELRTRCPVEKPEPVVQVKPLPERKWWERGLQEWWNYLIASPAAPEKSKAM